MKILLILLLCIFGCPSNHSAFFFSEEVVIAFSLVLFFILIVFMLKGIFLRSFFMEIKAIYTIFYYLFMLNLKFINIVSLCVNFLILKYKYSFGGEFYFVVINSYILFLNAQKNQILYVIDNLVSNILKNFFVFLFKVYKFSLEIKYLFINLSLYSKSI